MIEITKKEIYKKKTQNKFPDRRKDDFKIDKKYY